MEHRHCRLEQLKKNRMKIVITIGCVLSAIIPTMVPGYEYHAVIVGMTTNFIWIWT